jgi:hypothetical protein
MSLLLFISIGILAFVVGFVEYYIALRRTLSLIQKDAKLTFILVLVEGILSWAALGGFLSVEGIIAKVIIASLAVLGGAIGAVSVIKFNKGENEKDHSNHKEIQN